MPEASDNLKNVQFLRGQRGARAAAHRLHGFVDNAADESATQLNATAEIYRTVDDVPNTRLGARAGAVLPGRGIWRARLCPGYGVYRRSD